MMYKHQIDDCIRRAEVELRVYRRYHRIEQVDHVERRLQSLRRIRKKAPTARIGAMLVE